MKRLFAHFVALEIVALLHTQGVNAKSSSVWHPPWPRSPRGTPSTST